MEGDAVGVGEFGGGHFGGLEGYDLGLVLVVWVADGNSGCCGGLLTCTRCCKDVNSVYMLRKAIQTPLNAICSRNRGGCHVETPK